MPGRFRTMKRVLLVLPLLNLMLSPLWANDSSTSGERDTLRATINKNSTHWSFKPVTKPDIPTLQTPSWARNAIDYFVLSKLESTGIRPSSEADKETLIRRLSLDLLGLLPAPAEVDSFLRDNRPDAYEKLVDSLLNSPHYGERWGRHWLDLARYADSNGFNIDAPRNMWKYRDWVIHALNQDMPFDRFVVEQIAGDMLPNASLDQIIATGFHRNTLLNQEGGIDKEQYRVEYVVDRVNTTGIVFLGLTLGCARCHSHKFDPVSQEEFYEFFAFFNSTEEPTLEIASDRELSIRNALRAQAVALEVELEAYKEVLKETQSDWESKLTGQLDSLEVPVQKALALDFGKRSEQQVSLILDAYTKQDPGFQQRSSNIAELKDKQPHFETSLVMKERNEPRETYVHIKGDFTRHGKTVLANVPAILHPLKKSQPSRLDMARWLVSRDNPLLARVTVNRFWQRFFGTGIVETENDFGTQGALPSHPELMDWLAVEFMDPTTYPQSVPWSVKTLHRLIVTSATYRQSSHVRPDIKPVDPYNRLLARQSRFRLDAEVIRDVTLTASGLLSRKIGGKSVFPPQPAGAMRIGQMKRPWDTSDGSDRYRRGMYTFFWRATPYPSLMVFDAPDSTLSCTQRNRSNTPLQALTLLNDRAFFELSRGLAERVLNSTFSSDSERIRYAFKRCLAREPANSELQPLLQFLKHQKQQLPQFPEELNALVPKSTDMDSARHVETAAWITLSRVMFNLDEFITRE